MPVDSIPAIGPLPALEAHSANVAPTGNGDFSRELAGPSGNGRYSAATSGKNEANPATREEKQNLAPARDKKTAEATRRTGSKRSAERESKPTDDSAMGQQTDSLSAASSQPEGSETSIDEAESNPVADLPEVEEQSEFLTDELQGTLDQAIPILAAVTVAAPIQDVVAAVESANTIEVDTAIARESATAAVVRTVPIPVVASVPVVTTQEKLPTEDISAEPVVAAREDVNLSAEVVNATGADESSSEEDGDEITAIQAAMGIDPDAEPAVESQETADEVNDATAARPVVERARDRRSRQTPVRSENPVAERAGRTRPDPAESLAESNLLAKSTSTSFDALQEVDLDSSPTEQNQLISAAEQGNKTAAAAATFVESIPTSAATSSEVNPPPATPTHDNAPSRFQVTIGGQHMHRGPRGSQLEVDTTRFLQRVSRAFAAAESRGGEVRLRLSPPELGAMQLEVSIKAGVLTATIETETSAAQTILLDNLPQLRERLAEQGMQIEKFDVNVADRQSQGMPGSPQEQRDERERSARQQAALVPDKKPATNNFRRNDGTLDGDGLNVLV